ncbi:hypothetical protein [Microbacterium sp. BK668]|uniref:hypothetical protein n=1 Tax=Microbacterium sp. BK668 TaxID=2512118 RepID=UPI00105BFE7E|nr:hypothetical protein [Microbacterium sp. BK668]TDN92535.1 hypothetical protein EV279_2057 [Microbacterium sp. BK668]
MGLFTQRPEENEEWAGLPSEPHRPESAAEMLTDASSPDAAGVDLFPAAGSIAIPVIPPPEGGPARTADDREDGAAADAEG